VDPRDASQDVWIETAAAKAAYQRGEIAVDVTNGAYCAVPDARGSYPPLHLPWKKK
jgi:hypothetical protein